MSWLVLRGLVIASWRRSGGGEEYLEESGARRREERSVVERLERRLGSMAPVIVCGEDGDALP